MRDKSIRQLPVVDNAGKLHGMISDRDLPDTIFGPAIAEHVSQARQRLRGLIQMVENLRVKDLMTGDAAGRRAR